jgi:hypothetical protein
VTAVPQDPATALPGWMDLPDGLSAAEYEALPEDICRRIEIVDGAIIVNAAPPRAACSRTSAAASRTRWRQHAGPPSRYPPT